MALRLEEMYAENTAAMQAQLLEMTQMLQESLVQKSLSSSSRVSLLRIRPPRDMSHMLYGVMPFLRMPG